MKVKLRTEQVNLSFRHEPFRKPIEIRQIYNDIFTIFLRNNYFPDGLGIGWDAFTQHGEGFQNYSGWNMWDVADTTSAFMRLKEKVEDVFVIWDVLCLHCKEKVDRLCSPGRCKKCCPKTEVK